MKKILLIDDNVEYLEMLSNVLSTKFEVDALQSPKEGLVRCAKNNYDLIIIDYYMKELNADTFIDLSLSLFETQKILVISGKASVEEQVSILDTNIIDFLDKSTATEVLLKKIERFLSDPSQLRTVSKLHSAAESISIDVVTRETIHKGEQIHLTNKEFLLLKLFLSSKNKVLSRHDIYDAVWGKDVTEDSIRLVDINVLKLRKKLKIRSIFAERGIGYVWSEK